MIKVLNLTKEELKTLEQANDILEEIEEFADGQYIEINTDQVDIFECMVGMSSNILELLVTPKEREEIMKCFSKVSVLK